MFQHNSSFTEARPKFLLRREDSFYNRFAKFREFVGIEETLYVEQLFKTQKHGFSRSNLVAWSNHSSAKDLSTILLSVRRQKSLRKKEKIFFGAAQPSTPLIERVRRDNDAVSRRNDGDNRVPKLHHTSKTEYTKSGTYSPIILTEESRGKSTEKTESHKRTKTPDLMKTTTRVDETTAGKTTSTASTPRGGSPEKPKPPPRPQKTQSTASSTAKPETTGKERYKSPQEPPTPGESAASTPRGGYPEKPKPPPRPQKTQSTASSTAKPETTGKERYKSPQEPPTPGESAASTPRGGYPEKPKLPAHPEEDIQRNQNPLPGRKKHKALHHLLLNLKRQERSVIKAHKSLQLQGNRLPAHPEEDIQRNQNPLQGHKKHKALHLLLLNLKRQERSVIKAHKSLQLQGNRLPAHPEEDIQRNQNPLPGRKKHKALHHLLLNLKRQERSVIKAHKSLQLQGNRLPAHPEEDIQRNQNPLPGRKKHKALHHLLLNLKRQERSVIKAHKSLQLQGNRLPAHPEEDIQRNQNPLQGHKKHKALHLLLLNLKRQERSVIKAHKSLQLQGNRLPAHPEEDIQRNQNPLPGRKKHKALHHLLLNLKPQERSVIKAHKSLQLQGNQLPAHPEEDIQRNQNPLPGRKKHKALHHLLLNLKRQERSVIKAHKSLQLQGNRLPAHPEEDIQRN